jgi:long-subunit acyl-CoA synthetase (AMP-forming)
MVPDNATPDDMAFMIEDGEASLLFLADESQLHVLLPHLPTIGSLKKIVLFDEPSDTRDRSVVSYKKFVQSAQVSGKDLSQEFPGDVRITDLATIMYTSGTTGKPKGIMFSHLNIISKRFARALAWPMVGANDVFLSYLPLYHTFGRWLEMMGSLFWGATYVFVQSPSINNLIREMQIHRPTVFISIPQKWQQIYQYIGQQIDLERAPGGVVLPVRAHAGAKSSEVRGVRDGSLRVSVTQVAEKGKANKAIVAVLAKSLGLRKSQVELVSGATASRKRFLIHGVTVEQLEDRIGATER